MRPPRIQERFPLTLGVLAGQAFALVTLPFLGLSVDTAPDVAAKATILLAMFLAGNGLLIGTSIAFTGGFDLIKPSVPFQRLTQNQALLIVASFGIVGVAQLYVNQAFIVVSLASTQLATSVAPTSALAFTFAIDTAIVEEALLGAFTIFLFVTMRYFRFGFLESAFVAVLAAAGFFVFLHKFVYGTTPQALLFVFAARVVLASALLGTIRFSRNRRDAANSAPNIIHVAWNLGTLVG